MEVPALHLATDVPEFYTVLMESEPLILDYTKKMLPSTLILGETSSFNLCHLSEYGNLQIPISFVELMCTLGHTHLAWLRIFQYLPGGNSHIVKHNNLGK